jgi:predicted small lipoprotein YifL
MMKLNYKHRRQFILRILLSTIALTTLGACGQKGPLRLPPPLPPEKSAFTTVDLSLPTQFAQRAA